MQKEAMSPLISVIIPTCNGRARFIDKALASVFAQTCQDFELIIIDDASTDGTLEYVQELIPVHRRVIYHQRENNGGVPVARNDGAKRAKGEFLTFLDQDDLWEPAFLEETSTMLHSVAAEIACVYTDGYIINANGDILKYRDRRTKNKKERDNIYRVLSLGQDISWHGALLRKTAFDALHGFDERLRTWQDHDFLIRVTQHYRVSHLPKPLYRHRQYTHSVCKDDMPMDLRYASRTYFLEKYASACQQNPELRKVLAREWANLYSDMGKHYLAQNQRKPARDYFHKSLRLAPFSRRTILRYLRSYLPTFT